MSITRYGPANTLMGINTRKISEFSNEDEPIQIETLEDLRDLEIHHGGGAVITERVSEGAQMIVSLQPGTKDSSYCAGTYRSGEEIEVQLVTKGTGEKVILSGGICTKIGDVGRGFKPTNDNYTYKFSKAVFQMGAK